MKAFSFAQNQVASVAAALVVDELGLNFGRHVDALTSTAWSAETPLFEGGIELTRQEAAACADRLFRFFGASGDTINGASRLGDWVDKTTSQVDRNLTEFTFAAAGDGVTEVRHRADVIFADAASAANLLYGRRRILSLVAPHSLIGFMLSVLAPNLLQAPAVDVRGMSPEELKKFLTFGDALVATPSLWRYLIAQGVYAPDNAMAVFFGEPMTPELAAEIRKAGFGAQREIYGSTEHGLIGWRDSPSDPFALFDQWRRHSDDIRRLIPSGEVLDVTPMDVFAWESDRRFRLGVRRDGAVQIGAVNVFPARIAQKIEEHPEIARCEIMVAKHAAGADRLIARIELKKGAPPSETTARSIDSWCRTRLRPHERPRLYNYSEPPKK